MSKQLKTKNSSTIAGRVAFAVVTESFDGKKISGTLAIPRISVNGNLYLPEELQRGDGKIVPLYFDHAWKKGGSSEPVGEMALRYNVANQHLDFDAIVTNAEVANKIAKDPKKFGASLGATFQTFDQVCGSKACYRVLHGLNFIEGSITPAPSMPELKGMLTVVESIQFQDKTVKEIVSHKCGSCMEEDGIQVPTGGPEEDDGIPSKYEDDGIMLVPKGGGPAATSEDDGMPSKYEDDGLSPKDNDHTHAAEGIPKEKKDEYTNEDDKIEVKHEDDKIEIKNENDGIDGIPKHIPGEDDGIKANDKHPEDIPEDDPDRKEVEPNSEDEKDEEKMDKKDGDEDDDIKVHKRAFSTVTSKIGTITEGENGALYVRGILAVPRVTLNNSLILPQELAKGHGMTIPMSIDHEYTYNQNIAPVGSMSMRWNDSSMRLEFDGVITDKSVANAVRAGKYKSVSISISVGSFDMIYGFYVLKDIGFIEGSLTDNPAIPEATNTVIESVNSALVGQKFANVQELAKFVTNSLSINSKQSRVSMPEQKANPSNFEKIVTESLDKLTAIAEQQKAINAELKASMKVSTAKVGDATPERKDVATVQKKLAEIALQARANVLRQTKELNDSLVKQEYDRLIAASNVVTEGIDTTAIGTALGQYWTVDITTVPDYILANLRDTADQKIIANGSANAGTIHWTLMARPTWSTSSVTPPVTSPSEYNTSTYPITDVSKQAVTYYVFQRISDNVVAQATPDFMNKMQQLFVEGASILLDNLVLTELDGATPAATLYGDESVSAEANITASMTFSPTRIINGLKNLETKGFFPQLQEAVCVMHPVQMAAILQSSLIQNQLYYGTTPNSTVKVPVLFGVELRITNYAPTGTGSPTTVTTYHAFIYMKQVCIGLGMTQDVRIEIGRVVGEMATRAVGSIVAAAKLKTGNALVKIITA